MTRQFIFKTNREYEDEICTYARKFHLETDSGKKEQIKTEAFAFIDEYKKFLCENPLRKEGLEHLEDECGCTDVSSARTYNLILILEKTKEKSFDPAKPPSKSWLEKKVINSMG